jgi:hypothetical protein
MKVTRQRVLIVLLLGCIATWLVLHRLERSYSHKGKNYSLIEEGLYMGGDVDEPPPGTAAVLNLCEREDPYQCEVHVWESIHDGSPAPSIDWLRQQVKFIDRQRQADLTTYIHCRNGVSRSGMVVTAYIMYENHWSRNRALAFVRSKRPIARPNPAFMKRLIDWERVVTEPAAAGGK